MTFHDDIMNALKVRLDSIPSNEDERLIIWNYVAEMMELSIPFMFMFQRTGMNPNQFIEVMRAIADGIELATQEAQK
jgi:hypothetical protein